MVQHDTSTAVMWSKSKSEVEFQYGGRLGEFNGMSEPRATLQGEIIENRFSPNFIFLMQFRLWRAAAFVSSSIHLFIHLFILGWRQKSYKSIGALKM